MNHSATCPPLSFSSCLRYARRARGLQFTVGVFGWRSVDGPEYSDLEGTRRSVPCKNSAYQCDGVFYLFVLRCLARVTSRTLLTQFPQGFGKQRSHCTGAKRCVFLGTASPLIRRQGRLCFFETYFYYV